MVIWKPWKQNWASVTQLLHKAKENVSLWLVDKYICVNIFRKRNTKWNALFLPDTSRKKVKQPTSCAFLTLAERPWPQPLKHWKEEGRRVQRISQGFRSILVMTCQAKFLRQPPPGKTTWPFSKSIYCGCPATRATTVSLLDSKVQCISLE